MKLTDIIIVVIVALIVGLAAGYVYRQKKSGSKLLVPLLKNI